MEDDFSSVENDAKKLAESEENLTDATKSKKGQLVFEIDENPSLLLTLVFAFQQCLLSMFGSMIYPMIIGSHLCLQNNDDGDLAKAILAGTILVGDGVATFLQTTFGTRLPIIQGSSFSFVFPTMSLMALPHNKCPQPINNNITITNNNTITTTTTNNLMFLDTGGDIVNSDQVWMRRMNEIQGGLMLAALFEVACGLFGIVGHMTKFVGPLTITVCITMIGLDLVSVAPHHIQYSWEVALFTALVFVICSQYLNHVTVPYVWYSDKKWRVGKSEVFKLFPAIIAIAFGWLLSYLFTRFGIFSDDPHSTSYLARTDAKQKSLELSPWFRVPYPFEFGLPIFTVAGFVGMLAGTIPGIIESIGDYNACASLCETPSPIPQHAVNRGIMMEGVGCLWTGLLGTGTGSTSYSSNVAAIQITKVASRRVGQAAGIILIVLGCFTKVGAFIFTIPEPVFGGVFIVLFGMIIAVGLANLQTVDLYSSRNLFVIGFSFFIGRLIPRCIRKGYLVVNTGNSQIDQVLIVFMLSSIAMGTIAALITDNTLPGSREERGFKNKSDTSEKENEKCYDPPCCINNNWLTRCLPIFPNKKELRRNDEEKGAEFVEEETKFVE